MLKGYATASATAEYVGRFPAEEHAGFFRHAQGLAVSSIGMGSYLGGMDELTDAGYTTAAKAAIRGGINVIDTSLNYRHQRSEKAIGTALQQLFSEEPFDRSSILVCTKAGYLVPDAFPFVHFYEVVGNSHCLTPGFLADQLERSRKNLQLETIDVFYLHNPETQLSALPRELFEQRIRSAFLAAEQMVASGLIRYYGTATWDGYRKPGLLSLSRMAALAKEAGGEDHHFRFVQLPYNLAMTEAIRTPEGAPHSVIAEAQSLGITVVGSASLLQARLSKNLPAELTSSIPGLATDAQRALQFARSAPGVAVSLVGMSKPAHVEENLAVARVPPIASAEYAKLFASA